MIGKSALLLVEVVLAKQALQSSFSLTHTSEALNIRINVSWMISLKGLKPQKSLGLFAALALLPRPIGSKAMIASVKGKNASGYCPCTLLGYALSVFDEFTSVVDREIAKVSAYAISKAVRRSKKKFIAVTCHYDVVDWLEPDWVFCTDTMEFDRKKELGRPLNSKFIGAAQTFGRCFGSIII